ncbi:hypothetical protein ACFQ1M_15595 [Sungkyunkwania multivorans]|uniref:Yip1 domain-containing protein n=1 Tax=Sungkyunkwania multivorans TaxID=1173618 RepID=A0ABW3D3L9_9FLAO
MEAGKYFLDINQLVYNSLTETLSIEKVDQMFKESRKWQLIAYVLIPLLLFIKTHVIAAILNIGAFFFEKRISYKKLWGIVLRAEIVFIVVALIKTFWMLFFFDDYTLKDVQVFYPLSMLSIIGAEGIEPYFLYPLQVINAFEIIYWIVLALLLDKALKEEKGNTGIKIVLTSYTPALLIWVVAVMFFALNMS